MPAGQALQQGFLGTGVVVLLRDWASLTRTLRRPAGMPRNLPAQCEARSRRSSAAAFLKGYQSYGKSAKAPDSLLKLAMSLDRLGQRDAACSSYAELASRFPTAPTHIKNRAQTERQRIGCA